MAKYGFKKYAYEDIRTEYFPFGTYGSDTLYGPAYNDSNLVIGKINPMKKCLPAGSLVYFDVSGTTGVLKLVASPDLVDDKAKIEHSYTLDITTATVSTSTVVTDVDLIGADPEDCYFLLAEDCYAEETAGHAGGDKGFVYYKIKNASNLEVRR